MYLLSRAFASLPYSYPCTNFPLLMLLLLLSHFSRVQLCDPIDSSPPESPVPGILQARTMEWVTISFPNAGKWKVKVKSLSHVRLLVTPWTAAHQAPPSMGFSRQESWSGVPLPSPPTSHTLSQFLLPNISQVFFPINASYYVKMDEHDF